MTHRIFTLVCLLFFVVFQVQIAFAQDELSLDNSVAMDSGGPSASTGEVGAVPPETSELNLDSPMDASVDPTMNGNETQTLNPDSANPPDTLVDSPTSNPVEENPQMAAQTVIDPLDQAQNVNLASPEEILKRENALYGFSVGVIFSNQTFHEKYNVKSVWGLPNVNRETAAIQNAGIMVRYAVVPYYSLGTDMNISFMKSQNHSSVAILDTKTMAEINTLKAELNLTFAIDLAGHVPIYFLAGVGAERVWGGSVEELLQREGYGGQAGGGFVVSSRLNFEAVYAYYEHRISSLLNEKLGDPKQTTATGEIDMEKGRNISQGLVIRGTYSF